MNTVVHRTSNSYIVTAIFAISESYSPLENSKELLMFDYNLNNGNLSERQVYVGSTSHLCILFVRTT